MLIAIRSKARCPPTTALPLAAAALVARRWTVHDSRIDVTAADHPNLMPGVEKDGGGS
jgi:hypothetical protein